MGYAYQREDSHDHCCGGYTANDKEKVPSGIPKSGGSGVPLASLESLLSAFVPRFSI